MLPILILGIALAACASPVPPVLPSRHLSQAQHTAPPEPAPPAPAATDDAGQPSRQEETYSITVQGIPARDLLFALARDAGINIEIDPSIDGIVTLNAVRQPLPVLLDRIARQAALRYELAEHGLRILPDTPYLQHYPVDYVHLSRNVSGTVSTSMLIAAGAAPGGGTGNTSRTQIENLTNNRFWEQLEKNLQIILAQETQTQKTADSATRLLVSPETGTVSAFARQTTHQHLQGYINKVTAAARRQVMIEATIVEVALSEGYEQGIDWSGLVGGGLFEYAGNALKSPVNLRYKRNDDQGTLISLLQRFGTTRVLSTPRLSVLNNQTALLKVVENYVYFNVKADTTSTANVGTTVTYTTTPQTVSVGLVMGITPQISASDSIVLGVRPTITSIGREIADPNPELRKNGIENLVPMIRTREIESVMRIANGQIAVLGGLMDDRADYRTTRPPVLGELPLAGELFNNRANRVDKTELVIFLRPVVVREPGLEGDYAALAEKLPDAGFLKPPRHAVPFHNFPAP